jgi:hypothetical protein
VVHVYGDIEKPRQRTGPPDVVDVFVCDDQAVQAPGIYPNAFKTTAQFPAA